MNRTAGARHVSLENLSKQDLQSYRRRLQKERQEALAAAGDLDRALRRVIALVEQGERTASRYSSLRKAA